MFCQITQHLLENHEMWKRVIAAEVQEDTLKEDPNCLSCSTEPITAIDEEEEEQASKEEEDLTECFDKNKEVPTIDDGNELLQSQTSGGEEEESQ